jgi:hypothetical protein
MNTEQPLRTNHFQHSFLELMEKKNDECLFLKGESLAIDDLMVEMNGESFDSNESYLIQSAKLISAILEKDKRLNLQAMFEGYYVPQGELFQNTGKFYYRGACTDSTAEFILKFGSIPVAVTDLNYTIPKTTSNNDVNNNDSTLSYYYGGSLSSNNSCLRIKAGSSAVLLLITPILTEDVFKSVWGSRSFPAYYYLMEEYWKVLIDDMCSAIIIDGCLFGSDSKFDSDQHAFSSKLIVPFDFVKSLVKSKEKLIQMASNIIFDKLQIYKEKKERNWKDNFVDFCWESIHDSSDASILAHIPLPGSLKIHFKRYTECIITLGQ